MTARNNTNTPPKMMVFFMSSSFAFMMICLFLVFHLDPGGFSALNLNAGDFYLAQCFMPCLDRVRAGWKVLQGELALFIGYDGIRVLGNIEESVHPGMTVA